MSHVPEPAPPEAKASTPITPAEAAAQPAPKTLPVVKTAQASRTEAEKALDLARAASRLKKAAMAHQTALQSCLEVPAYREFYRAQQQMQALLPEVQGLSAVPGLIAAEKERNEAQEAYRLAVAEFEGEGLTAQVAADSGNDSQEKHTNS